MFGFLRKKKNPSPYDAFLNLPDNEFLTAVQEILSESEPATHAMYVVAYQNQAPMMTAMERLPMKDPSQPWNTCEVIKIHAYAFD